MLEDFDILFFSSDDWCESQRTSKFHLSTRLARANRVLYVNSIGQRSYSMASGGFWRKAWRRLRTAIKGVRRVQERLWVLTPVVLPFHRYALVRNLNRVLLIAQARYSLRRLRMKNPLLFVFLPNHAPLVGRFRERVAVYYCVDEHTEFDGVPRRDLQALERELLGKADVVFVTSRTLLETKRAMHPNVHYSPHGVDVELFGQALGGRLPKPIELEGVTHPIMGFHGLLDRWVDFDLLERIAETRPAWSIVLIGNTNIALDRLLRHANIRWLGPVEYERLPEYVAAYDVAMIPFVDNELTRNFNPLKLFEYFAAGKPVVSSEIPEVLLHRPLVRTAATPEEFIRQIEEALAEASPETAAALAEAVKDRSWDQRMEAVSGIILSSLRATSGADSQSSFRAISTH